MCYIIPDSSITTDSAMANLKERITQATADCDCELSVSSASSMMSSVTGSGLTVNLTGDENDTLLALSNQVVDAIESIEGYENASNGQETADATIKLSLDANLLAQQGTTVAQVYQQIAGKLNSTVSSITLNDDAETEVSIVDNRNQITPESLLETTYTVSVTGTDGTTSTKEHRLSEVGSVQMQAGVESLTKTNGVHSISVTADVSDGYNTTLLSRQLEPKLAEIDVPDGYKIEIGGNNEQIYDMLEQMAQLMALGALLIYLVMMAQFQSIMMPLIIIVTVPLAFTGGLLALLIAGEQLSVMSLLGFVILMGTVVNNGIVFVDYTNQLRRAGMPKRTALIAAGKTRMRPILVTALTTILSMCALIFNPAIGASLQRGMALVVAGGLLYATIMTLLVVPIVYDIMSRKPLKVIDIGSDIDEETGDAEYFMNEAEIEASNHEVSNHEVSNQAEFVAEENTGTSKYQSPYTNL